MDMSKLLSQFTKSPLSISKHFHPYLVKQSTYILFGSKKYESSMDLVLKIIVMNVPKRKNCGGHQYCSCGWWTNNCARSFSYWSGTVIHAFQVPTAASNDKTNWSTKLEIQSGRLDNLAPLMPNSALCLACLWPLLDFIGISLPMWRKKLLKEQLLSVSRMALAIYSC